MEYGEVENITKKKRTKKKRQEKWKKRGRENCDDGVFQNDDTTCESDRNYVN